MGKRMHTGRSSGYSSNAHAFAELDAMCDRLRRVREITVGAASDCVEKFRAKVAADLAAQTDVYGHAFRPANDGRTMLTNAEKAVSIESSGSTVSMRIDGPEAMHHVGSAKGYRGGSARLGGYRRSIIPFSKLPGPWKAILRDVLLARAAAHFAGRK